MPDVYTHGHHESVLRSHRWRTAENSAAYLLPHLTSHTLILDIGCGPGTITADFADRVPRGHVTGVDAAPDIIEQARALTRGRGNLDFAVGDVYALGYPAGAFDVVHAHQVLQHLGDPVKALREMRRVTRPGGWIVLTTPNQLSALSLLCLAAKGSFSAFQDGDYPAHRTALLEIDLRRIASESGLEEVAVEYTRWGRLPLTPWHYPGAIAALAPRRCSDNVAIVGRRCASRS